MAIDLKDLIESIKTEGFQAAEVQAAEILKEATAQKEALLKEAQKEGDRLLSEAKQQAAKEVASGEAALQQSARNLVLTLKQAVQHEFSKIIEQEVSAALNGDLLKACILSVVRGLAEDKSELTVLVDAKTLAGVEQGLRSELAAEFKKGLEIKPFPQLNAGFRVAMKDGSAYYDFSDKAIALLLAQYLNQRLADLLLNE